ncbi:S-layer homology domain-containing protein [Brevibacillus antibioticus]|uniref:S-layer homology domain-containing protein n=1 Tax=Brevibacillus antibioticus TaxID=2570228 RepID=A0A4U2YF74_9BACL|nr:S-layer homology domain-containing protein [Brevibacillus antibioticus]TKI59410.1 S-layer homology domain-containing protein [Brevibacillus antibioticus]
MKKVVNSVLASALALTVAPMAFAAEEAATTTTAPKMDADMEKTVKRLEALGLVSGYGNGEYGVDKTITRAEFATLVVRARALEQGAKLAQFNTTFSDVRSTDWFAGFVNVASGQEIIKGFPNKTFKPQDQVTYAQAVTMIVRALGYEPSVKGVWPNSMIAKASELNIARNITTPDVAATRGEIFKMLDNALRVDLMEQLEYGTDVRHQTTKETLLTKYLKVTVRDMEWSQDAGNDSNDLPLVTNVPAIGLGKIKANEVTLNGKDAGLGNTTYKVADGINANDFAGQHVQVWIKDNREKVIVWMEGSTDEEVIMDRVGEFTLKGKTIDDKDLDDLKNSDLSDLKLELDASEKSYRFNKNTQVTYNFTRFNDAVDGLKDIIKDNSKGSYTFGAKVVLDNNNEIAYIHVIDDQSINKEDEGVKYGSEVIAKIDADNKKITNRDNDKFSDLEGKEEGKDFLVFINGKPSKFSDLAEGMVYSVYYADGDEDKLLVFATNTPVEGKVEKVNTRNSNDVRLVIEGKPYRIYEGVTFSDDGNKDVQDIDKDHWDLVDSLDDETVKLYLDASGRVRHIETKDAIDDRKQKAIITRGVIYDPSKDTYNFRVLMQKGKERNVSLKAKDIYDFEGKNYGRDNMNEDDLKDILVPSKGKDTLLVEVTLDSNGDPSKVEMLKPVKVEAESGKAWDDLADEDDNMVGDYEVTDKTAVFNMTGDLEESKTKGTKELKNAKTAKFKTVADENDLSVIYTINDKDEVEAIFVIDGDGLDGDSIYGQVNEFGRAGGKDTIKVWVKDGDKVVEKEYKLNGDNDDLKDRGINRHDFIAFTLDSNEEVVVNDVVEVVNIKPKEKMLAEVTDEKGMKEANIDKMVVGLVTDVNKDTITYKDADDNKKKASIKSATAYFDLFDKYGKADGVSDGDYVVMIDSADISGTKYDFVVIVSDEKTVRKEKLADEAEAFLKQEPAKPDPGNDKWDALPSSFKGTAVDSLGLLQVVVELNKDFSRSDVKDFALYIEGKKVDKSTYEMIEEGNGWKVQYYIQDDSKPTKGEVKVTNAKGETDTASVKFEEA